MNKLKERWGHLLCSDFRSQRGDVDIINFDERISSHLGK